jgi:hypothetical protein
VLVLEVEQAMVEPAGGTELDGELLASVYDHCWA